MINIWKTYTSSLLSNKPAKEVAQKFRNISKFSTKALAVDEVQDKELTRTIDKISNIKAKEIKKKPQKPPFAKNLFLGIFDGDILAYPEVLEKQMVESLENDILPIKDYFDNIDDKTEKGITRRYLSNLSNLKLIGLQQPNFDGGRELTVTETCRYFEEMAKNTSRIGAIENEQLGIQILLKHGKDEYKKYLQELLDGKSVISCCTAETDLSASASLKTNATLSLDKKTWIVNGTKKWVVNGDIADLFIVFADAKESNIMGLQETVTCAFLVERSFGGITSIPCNTTGLDQTDISDIRFENTPVPAENLIGGITSGNAIISSVINEYRLSRGPMCSALLKMAANKFINHCIEISSKSANIMETDAVQAKIGELTTMLYAIESVTYLTAGLIDQYENQDCELESAIAKMVSTHYCHNSIRKIMDFMGTPTYMKDHWCNELFRNSLGLVMLNEPVDNLKIVISLLGLQHAGTQLQKTIKMIRNPLFHPAAMFKRMWTQRKHIEDNPKLTLALHEYLHPSAVGGAQCLEYSVLRLQFATETLLARHGPQIVNKHVELHQLADCISDIYAMTAVLGRASRSYCIGLRHANIEVQIATVFASKAMERVKHNVKQIWEGTYNTGDEKHLKVGKYSIKQKEYFLAHPLARNY